MTSLMLNSVLLELIYPLQSDEDDLMCWIICADVIGDEPSDSAGICNRERCSDLLGRLLSDG